MTEHLLDGVLFRACVYLALSLSLGAVYWHRVIEPVALVPSRARSAAICALLATAVVLAAVQTTLTFVETWSLVALREVITETDYGRRLGYFAVATLAHAVTCISRRFPAALVVASGGALALATSVLGHAALEPSWQVFVHAAHILAVAVWLGGLFILLQRVGKRTATSRLLRSFSRAAAVVVTIIIATGIVRTLSFTLAFTSSWTLALAWKLLLVGSALLLALGHRRRGIQRIERESSAPAWSRFEVMLTFEVWLAACALLMGALLSQLDPT